MPVLFPQWGSALQGNIPLVAAGMAGSLLLPLEVQTERSQPVPADQWEGCRIRQVESRSPPELWATDVVVDAFGTTSKLGR